MKTAIGISSAIGLASAFKSSTNSLDSSVSKPNTSLVQVGSFLDIFKPTPKWPQIEKHSNDNDTGNPNDNKLPLCMYRFLNDEKLLKADQRQDPGPMPDILHATTRKREILKGARYYDDWRVSKEFCEKKQMPSVPDEGLPLLHYAAYKGDTAALRCFMKMQEAGSPDRIMNKNIMDSWYRSAVYVALDAHEEDDLIPVIKTLMAHGVNLDTECNNIGLIEKQYWQLDHPDKKRAGHKETKKIWGMKDSSPLLWAVQQKYGRTANLMIFGLPDSEKKIEGFDASRLEYTDNAGQIRKRYLNKIEEAMSTQTSKDKLYYGVEDSWVWCHFKNGKDIKKHQEYIDWFSDVESRRVFENLRNSAEKKSEDTQTQLNQLLANFDTIVTYVPHGQVLHEVVREEMYEKTAPQFDDSQHMSTFLNEWRHLPASQRNLGHDHQHSVGGSSSVEVGGYSYDGSGR